MNVTGIIVAAGKGVRMGGAVSKQFLPLNGRPILAYTISGFNASKRIRRIILVLSAGDIEYFKTEILPGLALSKRLDVVSGGGHRQDSVYNGLSRIRAQDDIVLIHDGVRPFVYPEQIAATVETARETGACILAMPATDTLKQVGPGRRIHSTLERKNVWLAQTPQAFRFAIIWQAHRAARRSRYTGTDDAQLVERIGVPVAVVPGSPYNIKITTPADLVMAEAILGALKKSPLSVVNH